MVIKLKNSFLHFQMEIFIAPLIFIPRCLIILANGIIHRSLWYGNVWLQQTIETERLEKLFAILITMAYTGMSYLAYSLRSKRFRKVFRTFEAFFVF